jgi:hypothetical protein
MLMVVSFSTFIVGDPTMAAHHRICAVLFFVFFNWVAVAQKSPMRADGFPPVFISTGEAMKLYLDQVKAAPDTNDTGGSVSSLMRRAGITSAWVRVQILVDERGQVQGVQSIDGTPQVLSAAVREVRRYKFKPYITESGATPFVTVLNFKYDVRRPECSMANPNDCS